MENKNISEIITKIKLLELELEAEVQKKRDEFFCDFNQHHPKFKEEVITEHKQHLEKLSHYLATSNIWTILTAPVIWAVIVPALILDGFVSFYQFVCFPIYRIQKVKRSDYIVIDRYRLQYLNIIERINCFYCSYFNGLMAYITEVAARTEQHWCPIKHASNMRGMHSKYQHFLDYGDALAYRENLTKVREALKETTDK
jgi:hypothetical protein